MTRTHLKLSGIAATLSLMIATAVYAFPGGPGMGMGPGMRMGIGPMMGPNPSAMAEGHLSSLKSELKITTEQEPAWQVFSTKAKQQVESMLAMRSKMQEATGSAPERMSQNAELMKLRLGSMESMTSAMKDLYAVLTPEQKAVADRNFGMMQGRPFARVSR